jgi:hypothetical protein
MLVTLANRGKKRQNGREVSKHFERGWKRCCDWLELFRVSDWLSVLAWWLEFSDRILRLFGYRLRLVK